MQNKDLNAFRQDYSKGSLEKAALMDNPYNQFEKWFNDVVESGAPEPNAVFLSTVNEQAQPSCRTVLIKEFNDNGFIFYTNYESKKASDISVNPSVSLLFFWHSLQRQVRIEGKAFSISPEKSDAYFKTRSRSSQIGANISPQSNVIESREWLENAYQNFDQNQDQIDRPVFWGGYTVLPHYFEFWQGRTSRLHDRFIYSLNNKGAWTIKRLAP